MNGFIVTAMASVAVFALTLFALKIERRKRVTGKHPALGAPYGKRRRPPRHNR